METTAENRILIASTTDIPVIEQHSPLAYRTAKEIENLPDKLPPTRHIRTTALAHSPRQVDMERPLNSEQFVCCMPPKIHHSTNICIVDRHQFSRTRTGRYSQYVESYSNESTIDNFRYKSAEKACVSTTHCSCTKY